EARESLPGRDPEGAIGVGLDGHHAVAQQSLFRAPPIEAEHPSALAELRSPQPAATGRDPQAAVAIRAQCGDVVVTEARRARIAAVEAFAGKRRNAATVETVRSRADPQPAVRGSEQRRDVVAAQRRLRG